MCAETEIKPLGINLIFFEKPDICHLGMIDAWPGRGALQIYNPTHIEPPIAN
jgi:hypothetical protein